MSTVQWYVLQRRRKHGRVLHCRAHLRAGSGLAQGLKRLSMLPQSSSPVRAALHRDVHVLKHIGRLQRGGNNRQVLRDKRRICHAHAQHRAWPSRSAGLHGPEGDNYVAPACK